MLLIRGGNILFICSIHPGATSTITCIFSPFLVHRVTPLSLSCFSSSCSLFMPLLARTNTWRCRVSFGFFGDRALLMYCPSLVSLSLPLPLPSPSLSHSLLLLQRHPWQRGCSTRSSHHKLRFMWILCILKCSFPCFPSMATLFIINFEMDLFGTVVADEILATGWGAFIIWNLLREN